jgi:hypothetical protein
MVNFRPLRFRCPASPQRANPKSFIDIIGNTAAFVFCQFVAKSANKLACASQREFNGEGKHVLQARIQP